MLFDTQKLDRSEHALPLAKQDAAELTERERYVYIYIYIHDEEGHCVLSHILDSLCILCLVERTLRELQRTPASSWQPIMSRGGRGSCARV